MDIILYLIIFLLLVITTFYKNDVYQSMIEENKTSRNKYYIVVFFAALLYWVNIYLTKYIFQGKSLGQENIDISLLSENSLLFTMFGVIAYVMIVASYEDLKILAVNRYMLRSAYLTNNIFAFSYIYQLRDKVAEYNKFITYLLLVLYFLAFLGILLFGNETAGPSDFRMLMTTTPLLVVAFGWKSCLWLLGILFIAGVYQRIIQIIKKNKKLSVPLAPVIMLPMIFVIGYIWTIL